MTALGALFLESRKSVNTRRLAVAYAHMQLHDAFPGLDFMTGLVGREISVQVAPAWWWWPLLQLPRLWLWLRVRSVLRAAVGTIKADVTLHVGFG